MSPNTVPLGVEPLKKRTDRVHLQKTIEQISQKIIIFSLKQVREKLLIKMKSRTFQPWVNQVKIKKDPIEAANFFGKTAYYSPTLKEIVLYVEGRHNKDIVRSFAHEMIHHIQNLEGRLGNITTSNTNEDDYLEELEKEAYLLGNITFRNWEDSLKNPKNDKLAKIEMSKPNFLFFFSIRIPAEKSIIVEAIMTNTISHSPQV